jgi:hypothetical protein
MQNDELQPLSEILVIGTPGTRRVAAFVEAAYRLGAPRVNVVSYLEVIHGAGEVPAPGTLVRIESPGECAETARALLQAGVVPLCEDGGVPITEPEIERLACDRGEILHPRQWFLGFREVLRRLDAEWSGCDLRWMSDPSSIVTAFDKRACLDLWSHAGLPIPRQFPGIRTYSQLRREIQDRHCRVFVKLRYGYSAMGAVALEWRDPLVRAITTVDVAWSDGRPRLFVTKRPRQLQREFEIAWLFDTLAMEDILVEEWLPKARWEGRPYDLRIVTIDGKARHVVGRSHASPFTNLNLDARRIPRDVIEQQLGSAWPDVESLCESAAAAIPGAGMLGLDVLVRPCRRKFTLLEANAFGDYLPGLLDQGQSTYEAELQALRSSPAGVCV